MKWGIRNWGRPSDYLPSLSGTGEVFSGSPGYRFSENRAPESSILRDLASLSSARGFPRLNKFVLCQLGRIGHLAPRPGSSWYPSVHAGSSENRRTAFFIAPVSIKWGTIQRQGMRSKKQCGISVNMQESQLSVVRCRSDILPVVHCVDCGKPRSPKSFRAARTSIISGPPLSFIHQASTKVMTLRT